MVVSACWLLSVACLIASVSAGVAQTAPDASAAATPAPAATPHPAQITWSSVRIKEPYVAMTFDDGPSAKLTPKLLDLLKERHIHVTFFVLGENATAHPEILKRAVAEGHEIANHSWDHPILSKMSEEAVRSQLNRTSDVIAKAIGKAPTLMRPPYGAITPEQKKWIHGDLGYKIILWDVDPLDWKRPGPEAVHQRIVKDTRAGSIMLSHDIHPGTVEAMPATLDELLAKGFKFVTVSELLAMELPPEAMPKPTSTPHSKNPKTPKPGALPPGMPDKINGAPADTKPGL